MIFPESFTQLHFADYIAIGLAIWVVYPLYLKITLNLTWKEVFRK